MKILVGYPGRTAERQMLDRLLEIGPDANGEAGSPEAIAVAPVLGAQGLHQLRQTAHRIYVDERIRNYALGLVEATRPGAPHASEAIAGLLRFGASPRASLHLVLAARGHALVRGRGYVLPEDVKEVAPDVLRHRIGLSYEAEADEISSDEILSRVLERVPVP